MRNLILYNDFINTGLYTNNKGEGGNEIYWAMLSYIKNVNNEDEIKQIKEEIELWLTIGRISYFVMAVNLVGDLKLYEFEQILKDTKIEIIKKYISEFPDYLLHFIDNALNKMKYKI